MPSAAIASGACPVGHAGHVARDPGELLGEGDGHRTSDSPAPSTGRLEVGAQLLGLAEVDVLGARSSAARSSGAAPGSPAPSSPARRSRAQHSSGTASSPSWRAATAGNSASRSSVAVKMQLTIVLGPSAVAVDQLAASAPRSRRGSTPSSLRSAWTAPRTAQRRWVLPGCRRRSRPGILPEPVELGCRQQAAPAADGELAERAAGRSRSARASTTPLPTASAIRRTWRLRPSRRTISITRGETRRTSAGAVGPSSSSTPVAQPAEVAVGRRLAAAGRGRSSGPRSADA